MGGLNNLRAQLVIHWNIEDLRALRPFALQKPPTFQELLDGDAPHTEWFGQMTIPQAPLAGHLA